MTDLERHSMHVNGPRRKQSVTIGGVYGIGTNDVGWQVYWAQDNKTISVDPSYRTWHNIISRCDKGGVYQQKRPTYAGCSVDPRWHNYSVFVPWWVKNYVEGWQLDKDLLTLGNKVYGPDSAIFVPRWLNIFTVARGAGRGEYPIGLCFDKDKGKFKGQCNNPVTGAPIHLGYHQDPLISHRVWLWKKLELAEELKPKMDEIDPRVYPNVVLIIKGCYDTNSI